MACRAIITLETDHLGTWKILFKAQDVADFGTPPAINRLVVVANATNILVMLGQQPKPEILRNVGVLIFVDKNISVEMLIFGNNIRVGGKQFQAMQQQIAKIGSVKRP